jgi:hypothetical protein
LPNLKKGNKKEKGKKMGMLPNIVLGKKFKNQEKG